MAIEGTPQSAPEGARGFDTEVALTETQARQMKDAGFDFCVRYLECERVHPYDLTADEVQRILAASLALMAVQHVRAPGWLATAALGTEHAQTAVRKAAAAGLPPGINVWLDLEGVDGACGAADATAYCNDWYATVAAAGYVPGLYVGTACILSGLQLDDLRFAHYWKSLSESTTVLPVRGYQMVQSAGPGAADQIGASFSYDVDVTRADGKGGAPVWLAP